MSMKKNYRCDICNELLKNPEKSFGVYFSNLTEFTLGGYGCTEGVHICYNCAKQLHLHLNQSEIKKEFI